MAAAEVAPNVPIVFLSGELLKQPGSAAWAAARAQVWEALEEFGCFEAIYDGISPELRQAAFAAAKELVSLPVETKRQNYAAIRFPGYESLNVDEALDPAAVRGFTDLMWPEGNPAFCEAVCNFAEAAAAVEGAVRRMVLESLGVEKYCGFHARFTKYKVRLSEYAPPASEGEAMLILPPHTDSSVTTLTLQNHVHGFEVKTKNGDWICVNPSSPSSLVFINGDAFRAWSNGRLYAPPHRVTVAGGEIRMVIMLFAVPKDEALVETPAELVDGEKNPARFRPYKFLEYSEAFNSLLAAAGDDPTSVLPAFCGYAAPEPKAET
ncbi:unnamed protein product [Spirodela intermedia]|uniref:Fe2OG dioxygenase domain-containing protein n=1 Tax=Spirodela intermedia TaxID=51605 RepID=A0A7I8IRY1_SPIIN|nr:unnamed protein product [Spirodela intermedia]CAA6659914.1 unnamed protein product [Spirodela intermedia]